MVVFRGEVQAGVVDLLGAIPAYPAVSDSRIGGEKVIVRRRERTETGPKSVSISPGSIIRERSVGYSSIPISEKFVAPLWTRDSSHD